jgi:transposase-like protein
MTNHKSEDYKLSAVNYYLTEDTSQLETCRIFKCTPRSLMRWVQQYKKEGNVNIHYRKPVAYKVKKEYVKFLLDEIKKNKTITLYELTEKLKETYKDVDLSTTQIFRVINDNNITLKLTRIRHEPTKRFGKDIDINSKIKEFYEEVKKYKIEDIICIDETSIKSLQKRNHCYSQKGKRCVIKTQSQEVFKKYTCVFAISVNGVVNWDLYEKGGITTDRLIEFLEHNITSKLRNKLIILDNASAHRNERIKSLVSKHNNILYAVPYQHFTNSIENYFSMLKSRLQKLEGLKYENLKENIQKVISEIPKEKYENIFKGAYDRPEKYVPKNKTRKVKKIYK